MKALFLLLSLAAFSTPVFAQLSDYNLRRLPGSVANEFQNGNGDTRMFIPTSINNQGHLSGIRLTRLDVSAAPEDNLFQEASYIYDLNTQQYIAQYIPGTSIVHMGEEYYIAKRLHPSVNRWQTYKCNYSVSNAEELVPSQNSECSLIDNDYLVDAEYYSGPELWRSAYQFSLFAISSIDQNLYPQDGVSFIGDFTDDPSKPLKGNFHVGPNIISSDAVIDALTNNGFPAFDIYTLQESLLSLSKDSQGSQILNLLIADNDDYRFVNVDLSDFGVMKSALLASDDPKIQGIIGAAANGGFYYEGGRCVLSDLCANQNLIDTAALEALRDSNQLSSIHANWSIFIDPNNNASFFKFCYSGEQVPDATGNCSSQIYFVSQVDSSMVVDDVSATISDQFQENVMFGSPYFEGDDPLFAEGSPNAKYLVVVVPTTAKRVQGYSFIKP